MTPLGGSASARLFTAAAAVVPATLLVLLASLLVFVALFLGTERRRYAERIFEKAVEFADVLVRTGARRPSAGRM